MPKKNAQAIPEEVGLISDTLQKNGFEAYLVGGCVRDLILGKTPKDWDLATNATPEETSELFEHTFNDNQFGTVGVVNDDADNERLKVVEITTYRLEAAYSDARHPDKVVFSDKLEDDLKRRDFTVNALALHVPKGERTVHYEKVVDLFEGIQDLKKKQIRAVGTPDDRFSEDALRMLRAVRLAAELGFSVEEKTAEAIKNNAKLIDKIAMERIRDEFVQIIMSDEPRQGIELAHDLGLLERFIPELTWAQDVEQNQAHSYAVWEHLLRSAQAAAEREWPLAIRLAALLHDIGKPKTREWDETKNDWSFHNHEVVGATMTHDILTRLRFSKEIIKKVRKLVRYHMFFSDTDVITHSAVRRLMRNVGTENVDDLMRLRRSDRIGTGRPKEEPYRLRKYQAMIEEVRRDPISVNMLAVDGNRVMEITEEGPGPRIGWILHALLEEVLDDPEKNTVDYLEKRVVELSELEDNALETRGSKGQKKKEREEEKEIQEIRSKYFVE